MIQLLPRVKQGKSNFIQIQNQLPYLYNKVTIILLMLCTPPSTWHQLIEIWGCKGLFQSFHLANYSVVLGLARTEKATSTPTLLYICRIKLIGMYCWMSSICYKKIEFASLFFFFHFQVIRHFDGCKADLVVCDGAPDGRETYWSLHLN